MEKVTSLLVEYH